MKKRILTAGIIAGLAVAMAAVVTTGSSKAAEENIVTGSISDMKDFMFTVEDASGNAYGFAFDKMPEGYETIKAGDEVVVDYSGDISEADAFTGTINSLKKVNEKSGTFTDKKDFMFTLEEADGSFYGFFFGNGNAPEGYDNLKEGDQVTVKYTGEINEVDAFEGRIISVTK